MKMIRYKDKCDLCNNFGYCIGIQGYLVCESCMNKPLPEHKKEEIKMFKFNKKGQMGLNI